MSFQQQLQKAFFEQQISGHSIFIKINNGEYIAKSCSVENNNEQNFYEWIQHINGYEEFFSQYNGILILEKNDQIESLQTDNPQHIWLNSLIQKRFNPNNKKYLLLQNLTYNYECLRILDLKLGFTVEKQSHIERYKDSTSSKIGFRICGMKIQVDNEIVMFKDKHWGRTISVEQLIETFKEFFQFDNNREKILKNTTKQIEEMKNFIKNKCQQVISWQGTSLLLIYRSDQDFKIRLIDFSKAKVDPFTAQHNQEIIKALDSLQDILQQI